MPTETHPGIYGLTKYWDVGTLRWVKGTQPGGGPGGGDASAANQVVGNASLSSIDGKTPALGQALAAASTPVVLTAIQFAALTPPAAITGYNLEATQLLVKAKTDNLDVLLSTRLKPADTLAGVTTVATVSAVTAITNALPAGANLLGKVGIDQTTPGTTNAVQANAGTNLNTSALALEATQLLIKAKTDNLDVLLSTRLKPADTLAGVTTVTTVTTVAAVTAITNALPAGTNLLGKVGIDQTTPGTTNNVSVTPPTLTKGTQAATGFSVQDLKDAGRNQLNFYMVIQIVTTATDALLALTGYKSGALVAATTTPAVVTAGKVYRINSVTMEYTSIVTTEGSVRFTLRANLSGTVVIGSPVVCVWEVGQTGSGVSVAGKKNTITIPFPDGIEFAAGTGIGISQVGLSPVGAAAIAGYGRISINGYEY